MYLFDTPMVPLPAADAEQPQVPSEPQPELEVSAVPLIGPDLAGAMLRVIF